MSANLQHQVGFIKKAATLSCNNVEQFLLFLPFSPKYIRVIKKEKGLDTQNKISRLTIFEF